MDFLSTYVLSYIHITTPSLDNCINLNKLKTLKNQNNTEIMKTWFSIKYLPRKYSSLKKVISKKTYFVYKILLFPTTRKNLSPLRTDVSIRFHALRSHGTSAARNREIMKPVTTLVSNRLNINMNIRGYKYTIKSIHNC